MKKRRAATKSPDTEMEKLRARMKEARAELRKAKKEAETGIRKSLRKFGRGVDKAERRLKNLRGTGREAWLELKKDVAMTWKDLKHFSKKATAQLRM